eukprot:Gb_05329 [translate_table: standard]
MCESSYLALLRSFFLLDRRTAAPPMRKKQLGRSMDLLVPVYQLNVIISVLTTTA